MEVDKSQCWDSGSVFLPEIVWSGLVTTPGPKKTLVCEQGSVTLDCEMQREAGHFPQGLNFLQKLFGLCWKDALKSAELFLDLLQYYLKFVKLQTFTLECFEPGVLFSKENKVQ